MEVTLWTRSVFHWLQLSDPCFSDGQMGTATGERDILCATDSATEHTSRRQPLKPDAADVAEVAFGDDEIAVGIGVDGTDAIEFCRAGNGRKDAVGAETIDAVGVAVGRCFVARR